MLKDIKGITLVELLAVLALLSMVLMLAISFYLFGQKQYTNQTSKIENERNVRLALNILTKEIRSAVEVEVTDNMLTILDTNNVKTTYKLHNHTIMKNNASLIDHIKTFHINKDGNEIEIIISSGKENDNNIVTESTIIYLRE